MQANIGSYDAAVRFVAGCAMLVFANHGQRWGLAGFALVITSAGWCPLYSLLRIGTAARVRVKPPPALRVNRTPESMSAPPRTRRGVARRAPYEYFSTS